MNIPSTAGTIARAAAATAVYGRVHSLLASAGAKRAAARWLGERHRAGLYRAFYNSQALITFGVLGLYLRRLPRREVSHVEGSAATVMRGGQLSGLLWAVFAARAVGIGPITGWSSFRDWVRGAAPFREPEAQGPAPSEGGGMRAEGPFRLSRHPLNVAPLPIFWLQPVMTGRWLAFNLVATAYLVLGSIHEEKRLEEAYGEEYRAYIEGGTPFYVPRPAAHGHRTDRRRLRTARDGRPH